MNAENNEELIQAARTASEPIDWNKIADYFADQHALVAPRETREAIDNTPDRGDS
jgi:hypothetical protein